MAENVKPFNVNNVVLSFNSAKNLVVTVNNAHTDKVSVGIYNSSFQLVQTETLNADGTVAVDLSKLESGHYIVKVERNGVVLHTEVVKNIR
jgi:predicted aspartyl protease